MEDGREKAGKRGNMKKTVMAIGGHIGDAELTCGGVLATMALKGYEIITVALTGGERGNPSFLSVEEYRKQKVQEAEKFAAHLGGKAIVFPYVDGELPDNEQVRMELCDLIRKYKPQALMTHWKNSMHKDHELTHKIVKDAWFYAGLSGLERQDSAHFAKGPYYAQNWEDAEGFQPYVYMEVTKEGFELWKKAIKGHWFAVNSKDFHYMEYYEHLMCCNGCLARTDYAEAFMINPEAMKLVLKEF